MREDREFEGKMKRNKRDGAMDRQGGRGRESETRRKREQGIKCIYIYLYIYCDRRWGRGVGGRSYEVFCLHCKCKGKANFAYFAGRQ